MWWENLSDAPVSEVCVFGPGCLQSLLLNGSLADDEQEVSLSFGEGVENAEQQLVGHRAFSSYLNILAFLFCGAYFGSAFSYETSLHSISSSPSFFSHLLISSLSRSVLAG